MIYVTSDLHFCHSREFLYEPRGFRTIEEHDAAVIERWNSWVGPEDDVYVLGDLVLNDIDKGIEYLKMLNGKIHVIRGNHDTDTKMARYAECPNIVEICDGSKFFRYKKFHFLLSHYPTLTSNYDNEKPLRARMINVCGHSHTKDRFADFDKGLIYHAELDVNDCYPIAIEEIIEDIKERLNGELY